MRAQIKQAVLTPRLRQPAFFLFFIASALKHFVFFTDIPLKKRRFSVCKFIFLLKMYKVLCFVNNSSFQQTILRVPVENSVDNVENLENQGKNSVEKNFACGKLF